MRTFTKTVFSGFVAALLASAVQAADYYVSITNVLGHAAPYTNWAMAATNIQFAVNEASADDTIWVGPGRYTAPTNAVYSASATNVVYLDKPLTLRSTAGAAETIIDGEGTNRGIVVSYSQAAPPFFLDGFTVTNGYALDGGGVYYNNGNNESHFLNCLFVANRAQDSGGALRDPEGSTIVISNSVFRQNHALHDTGENRGGGAIYKSGNIAIYDSLFEGNRATNSNYKALGGAIVIGGGTIERTIFRDNRCATGGNAGTGGGAIHFGGDLTVRNCLLHDNSARAGGAIALTTVSSGKKLTVENCTITRNHSSSASSYYSASGIYNRPNSSGTGNADLRIYNSIIYGNTGGPNINYHDTTKIVTELKHACTTPKTIHPENDAGFDTDNNITDDPEFVDPANGDFHLPLTSLCVNTGTNRDWHPGAVDLDGNRRVDGSFNKVDMGCYEYLYQGTAIMIR